MHTVERAVAIASDHSIAVAAELVLRLDPVTGGIEARSAAAHAAIDIVAAPLTAPIVTASRAPFGSGWIDWRAVPLLSVRGTVRHADGAVVDLDGALGYHDHNWGRWCWGEDIGWEWAAWPSEAGCLVMSRATDRRHETGAANVVISLPLRRGWQNQAYVGSSVDVRLADWRRGCRARARRHGSAPHRPHRASTAQDDRGGR